MEEQKIAAIDIGSNAVRLLISVVTEDEGGTSFRKLVLLRVPLRLGEDTYSIGKISDKRMRKLIKLMKAFRHLMSVYEVDSYRACATAAMREARNASKVVAAVKEKAELDIEIIDGSEEARTIYESHVEDCLDKNSNYLYVDVGGGSTELSVISKGRLAESASFNIGTIRMLRNKVGPDELERMNVFLQTIKTQYSPAEIIGSGGNINKLHKLANLKKGDTLDTDKLQLIYQDMKQLTVEERMTRFELNPDRADVIIPASEIFLHIADLTGIQQIYVPSFGLVDGLLHTIYKTHKNSKDPIGF
jgi:exopolyphosphatase / guanosine-5'-triphosphate,3'-diphosphate pyrophosphatase